MYTIKNIAAKTGYLKKSYGKKLLQISKYCHFCINMSLKTGKKYCMSFQCWHFKM